MLVSERVGSLWYWWIDGLELGEVMVIEELGMAARDQGWVGNVVSSRSIFKTILSRELSGMMGDNEKNKNNNNNGEGGLGKIFVTKVIDGCWPHYA